MNKTNRSYRSNKSHNKVGLIPPHGGYRNLKSYQSAEIIYDLTIKFCEHWIRSWKLREQMTGAARSGKQNIAEGCQVSGTSKKSELKLIGVARGSLEELLQDFEDFLRQQDLPLWGKNHPSAQKVRALAYERNRSYTTYRTYISSAESAANMLLCLIHQANYLLDQQLRTLEKEFLEKGGFTERLYQARKTYKTNKSYSSYTTYRTNKNRKEVQRDSA